MAFNNLLFQLHVQGENLHIHYNELLYYMLQYYGENYLLTHIYWNQRKL